MSYRLFIKILDVPTLQLAGTSKSKWVRITEKKKWEKILYFETLGKRPPEPLSKAKLTLTRFSTRCPDYDNNVSSFKQILDALVIHKIIKSDDMETIGKSDYNWEKAKIKHITILVEGI
jgi:hypothetical protein